MGFLSGSATFDRYRVLNDSTGAFGEEHLELLKKHKIKSTGKNLYEQPSVGFLGGAHLFDTKFDFEKNVIGDALHFAVRIDSCQIPGPIKRAWTAMELTGIMKDNPGGRPSKAQREEAKEAVEARCKVESEKGNFKKMSVIPVLWDSITETIYLGSTSEKPTDSSLGLIGDVFNIDFSKVTSGKLAVEFAETAEMTAAVYDATPTAFHEEAGGTVVWWNGMKDNYDFLGNEFLLWLWWNWQVNGDVIKLSDGSEVSGMFARSLNLDCPMGENGKESISSESPVALPEAMMAIQMGKLPRKAGLTLVRNEEQFDFALQSETFSFGSAKVRQVSNDTGIRDNIDRIESLRQMTETTDLLYEQFCLARFEGKWNSELKRIQNWLRSGSEKAVRKKAA
jgi:hypothetical protein